MRIIHFSTLLSRSAGGLCYSVSGLAKSMPSDSVDVLVIGGTDKFYERDQHIWADVAVTTFSARGSHYGFNLAPIITLLTDPPDILHIHGVWSFGSVLGLIASLMNIPVLVSPHGMLDPWILARKPLVKRIHAALFERPMLKRAHLHALNANELQSCVAFMPGIAQRSFALPNGIDDTPLPSQQPTRQGALYLGRVHEKKQTLELIREWSKLPEDRKLTVAGWGDPHYEHQVAVAAQATRNVTFAGSLYGQAKSEAFEQSRLFILPSLSEGLPMAVLEAIQHGCIPVITDACNLPELFADNVAERIEPDFSDFAPTIDRLYALPEKELQARSARSRSYARQYLWTRIARSMVENYQQILAVRKAIL